MIRWYGATVTARTTEVTGPWFGVWRTDPVRVILVDRSRRRRHPAGYDIAIVTTDTTATAADIVVRYAARWSIEICFHDARNILGVGETQNRVEKAVQRSVPFTFMCHTITILWFTLNANPETQIEKRRRNAPWYTTKTDVSTLDMLYTLRGTLTAHRITRQPQLPPHPMKPEPAGQTAQDRIMKCETRVVIVNDERSAGYDQR